MITAVLLVAAITAAILGAWIIAYQYGYDAGVYDGVLGERARTIRAQLDEELYTVVDLINSGELTHGSPTRE